MKKENDEDTCAQAIFMRKKIEILTQMKVYKTTFFDHFCASDKKYILACSFANSIISRIVRSQKSTLSIKPLLYKAYEQKEGYLKGYEHEAHFLFKGMMTDITTTINLSMRTTCNNNIKVP